MNTQPVPATNTAGSPVYEEVKTLFDGFIKRLDSQDAEIKRLSQPSNNLKSDVQKAFGAPNVREGEDSLTSRGYSFLKALGYVAGVLPASSCKVEIETHNRIHKSYVHNLGYEKAATNSFLMPFSTMHMCLEDKDPRLVRETSECIRRGISGVDWEEVNHVRQKYGNGGAGVSGVNKSLSWLDATVGGTLVPPPAFGELIELLRNNNALMSAGARDIGMPPSGRITFPRQTSAATAYWVGESNTTGGITSSTQGTGDLTLRAHKLACLVKIPNELFHFPTVAIEQFVREDMAQVMALKLDKTLLEDVGSSISPKGLINYSNINTITATGAATNGDVIEPNDIGRMIVAVEEANAEFTGWIMRPVTYSTLLNRRADAVSAGDKKGQFLFNMWRDYTDMQNRGRGKGWLEGYPVVKTTQVSNARTKGNSSQLTYILGGNFKDFIMALSGVIEFLVANQGDTMIVQDQTWVRGTQYADGAPRHEASFVLMDKILRDQS